MRIPYHRHEKIHWAEHLWFQPIEVFAEIFLRFLGQKCLLFSIIKERCLYSQKNFHGILENREKHESLAR